MRALKIKDGDLLPHSDKIDETAFQVKNTSAKHHLVNNHSEDVFKGKIKGYLPLEHVFRFSKAFKKNTKQVRVLINLKTADLQDINYASLGDIIKVKFRKIIFIRSNIHSWCKNTNDVYWFY